MRENPFLHAVSSEQIRLVAEREELRNHEEICMNVFCTTYKEKSQESAEKKREELNR